MKLWYNGVREDEPMLRAVQIERAEKTVGVLQKKQNKCFAVKATSGFLTVAAAAVSAIGFIPILIILMPALAVMACAAVVTDVKIALGKHHSNKETEELHQVNHLREIKPRKPS